MKRIAYLMGTLKLAGAQKILLDICKHLDKKKFKLFVIYWRDGELTKEFKKIKGVTLIKISPIPEHSIKKGMVSLKHIQEIDKVIKEKKIDILESALMIEEIYGTRVSMLNKNLKHIIHIQASDDYRKTLRWKLFCKLRNKHNDKFIACSEDTRQFVIKEEGIDEDKIVTFPSFVDLKLIEKEKITDKIRDDSQIVLLNIGRLTKQKGQKYLIEAFDIVKRKYPNAVLYIAGEGDLKEELEEQAKGKDIELLGLRKDIYNLLLQTDVFVYSSIYCGLSVAMLEAMAFKIPVASFKVSGAIDIIEHGKNGYLAETRNAEDLAICIIKSIENKQVGKEGYKTVKKSFDINKNIKELEEIYNG